MEPEEESPVSPPQYMNSAALSEIAGELLITVRELREELLQVIFLPSFINSSLPRQHFDRF